MNRDPLLNALNAYNRGGRPRTRFGNGGLNRALLKAINDELTKNVRAATNVAQGAAGATAVAVANGNRPAATNSTNQALNAAAAAVAGANAQPTQNTVNNARRAVNAAAQAVAVNPTPNKRSRLNALKNKFTRLNKPLNTAAANANAARNKGLINQYVQAAMNAPNANAIQKIYNAANKLAKNNNNRAKINVIRQILENSKIKGNQGLANFASNLQNTERNLRLKNARIRNNLEKRGIPLKDINTIVNSLNLRATNNKIKANVNAAVAKRNQNIGSAAANVTAGIIGRVSNKMTLDQFLAKHKITRAGQTINRPNLNATRLLNAGKNGRFGGAFAGRLRNLPKNQWNSIIANLNTVLNDRLSNNKKQAFRNAYVSKFGPRN